MGLPRPGLWDALDKGSPSARRGGAVSNGVRTCVVLALVMAAALFVVALQQEPAYRSIVHPLHTAGSGELPQWAPGRGGSYRSAVRAVHGGAWAQGERLLSFEVCGDPAMQRIALLSGLVLAAAVNRTAVLPRLLLDDHTAEFGDVYNADLFAASLQGQGVRLLVQPPDGAQPLRVDLAAHFDVLGSLQHAYGGAQHVSVSCPALRLPADLFVRHEGLVFAAVTALQLGQPLLDSLLRAQRHLQGLSTGGQYNVLYLHTEADWVQQCARWERASGGRRLDNCLNSTGAVGEPLRVHNVDTQVPLLLLLGQGGIDEELQGSALASLRSSGFTVVGWSDLPGNVAAMAHGAASLVQYYLALGAHQFAGNSVAVPDALLIMERWHAGRYATYYNGGNIPLEAHLPLFPMPWVFTYNDWSVGTEYEHMLKAAVTSAIEVGRVKPFCMFTGSKDSHIYQWLARKGITMIQHTPAWKDALIQESRTGNLTPEEKKPLSHLYKNVGAIVGAYLRIDIPKLPQLDQYNYVLFTDCDVYFRKHVKLIDWGSPLPAAIGMGYERFDLFPYNNGVMLWNMPFMKKTNAEFVEWILAQHNGLHYGKYSAVDQGAFNQFYEKEVVGKPLSRKFNAMIYHGFRDDALIVHLHGPKPNHYLEWMRTGNCSFGDMCNLGIFGDGSGGSGRGGGGLCKYVAEYSQYVPDWVVMQRLNRLCSNLLAGTWHPKF